MKRTQGTIFGLCILVLMVFAYLYFLDAPYRENEPATIRESQSRISDFFIGSTAEGPSDDLMPFYFMTVKGAAQLDISYKEIRLLSFISFAIVIFSFFWYTGRRAGFGLAWLFAAVILSNPLLAYYATLLRFWSMTHAFLALTLCLYFAIQNKIIGRQYQTLMWIFLLLSCLTNFMAFFIFFILIAIERKEILKDKKSQFWSLAIIIFGELLFLVKIYFIGMYRFGFRSIPRDQAFVFNTKYLQNLFSIYVAPHGWVGSILIGSLFVLVGLYLSKASNEPRYLRRIFWGSMIAFVFLFLCACFPFKEIVPRYATWILFVVLLCSIEMYVGLRKAWQKRCVLGLFAGILVWQTWNVAWIVRHKYDVDIPWEQVGKKILDRQDQISKICFHPKFVVQYLKYSSDSQYWQNWDQLVGADCQEERNLGFHMDIYWKNPSSVGAESSRVEIVEDMPLTF